MHSLVIKHSQIQHFDKVVATLTKPGSAELEMRSITDYLVQAQDQDNKHKALLGAVPALESLLVSHAHFPFTSPVILTRDALLRAVLLLTHHVDLPFKQACGVGQEDEIRTHSDEERIRFIYSALVCPPTGAPTHGDVLDIVSRVKYPWQTWGKGIVRRRLLNEFEPLARRLEPTRNVQVPESLLVEHLEPRWGNPVVVRFGKEDAVTEQQFVEWATKVREYLWTIVVACD
jgi:hypothetical protein